VAVCDPIMTGDNVALRRSSIKSYIVNFNFALTLSSSSFLVLSVTALSYSLSSLHRTVELCEFVHFECKIWNELLILFTDKNITDLAAAMASDTFYANFIYDDITS